MRASPRRCSGDQVARAGLDEGVAVDDVEGHVAGPAVDAGVAEPAVGRHVAAADLGLQPAGDGDLDDDLGARVLAEEPAAAVRGDDRDPVAEVAHVELLGALPGDADGGLGGVGGGHVDGPATVLDVEADRLRGVEGEVQLVAHRVS